MFSGNPYKRSGNELVYKTCPRCGNEKWNFQVNPVKKFWHCWACERGGRLKGLSIFLDAMPEEVQQAAQEQALEQIEKIIAIPMEATPLWLSTFGIEYMKFRGITRQEAIRHSLQCHENDVYVPYFENNMLVAYNVKKAGGKWMFFGPSREKVFYHIHGTARSVAIVEGIFDGIKVARTGQNVVVLFGRILYDQVLKRICQLYDEVTLALDNDSAGKSSTIKIEKKLSQVGLTNLWIARPPRHVKDFGECTTEEVQEAFNQKKRLTFAETLAIRLGFSQ